ncbi:MAG: hypothetical protein AAF512_12580 [Pseudomonadota bacterium]
MSELATVNNAIQAKQQFTHPKTGMIYWLESTGDDEVNVCSRKSAKGKTQRVKTPFREAMRKNPMAFLRGWALLDN